ncbi:hypothetical protein [Novosphingobium sp. ST904]|uniref:hypothetical protein n=1 Tax=Novosphingobium sp. ST904 TaxID=1684385 RepID=UPI0006C876AA|nr:hypothetical protein [Novosphingobium sp. ST904]TCM43058.1 hypothetical protein EDF59_101160 [Novosphingobium sp. ST904]
MKNALNVVMAATVVCMAQPVQAAIPVGQRWSIGEEREVDEGIYFKLLRVENGWRLWRIETRSSVECRAVKSARGKVHPFPIGAGTMFGFGEPYITIWKHQGGVLYYWKGADFENSMVQIRREGAKFWDIDKGDEAFSDSDLVEVNVSSWEYPAVRFGYHETRGVLDFTGWAAMRQAVDDCDGARP